MQHLSHCDRIVNCEKTAFFLQSFFLFFDYHVLIPKFCMRYSKITDSCNCQSNIRPAHAAYDVNHFWFHSITESITVWTANSSVVNILHLLCSVWRLQLQPTWSRWANISASSTRCDSIMSRSSLVSAGVSAAEARPFSPYIWPIRAHFLAISGEQAYSVNPQR